MTLAVLLRFFRLAVAGAALTAPAQAEGNRLLPFWGQPYPYGYARTGLQDAERRPNVTDPGWCRATRGYGHTRGRSAPCNVVLHARD